jgi:hypothetical protein
VKGPLLVVLVLAVAAGASAANGPDPIAQPPLDGCVRDSAAIAAGLAPGLVYVNGASQPQSLTGVVAGGAPSAVGDDFNLDVAPDAVSSFLLAAGAQQLQAAREAPAFPSFAWPEPGDRVQLLGSWVWNCTRWKPSGERTELHPFRAVWVQHTVSARSPWGESEGDLFVSTDSTQAGATADCALQAKGDSTVFDACLAIAPLWEDVSGDYRFVLPAPPRPPGAARLRVRVVDQGSVGAPAPTVTLRNGAAVVTMTLASAPAVPVVVAKQVFVGWTTVPATELPQHLRVSFRSLLVLDSQNSSAWKLSWDAAGAWGAWLPRALRPADGQSFAARQTVDVYLPRGRPWRLAVYARTAEGGTPGTIAHRFASPVASLGLHRDRSSPRGRYALTYVVTRVNDAVKRAAAQPR